ncbi:MAG: hypothetical protein ACI9VL_000661 [Colwellia sp.]
MNYASKIDTKFFPYTNSLLYQKNGMKIYYIVLYVLYLYKK